MKTHDAMIYSGIIICALSTITWILEGMNFDLAAITAVFGICIAATGALYKTLLGGFLQFK